ncbi:hypothetical protein V1515DRAFT_578789 [Lipomyces mesembrius]
MVGYSGVVINLPVVVALDANTWTEKCRELEPLNPDLTWGYDHRKREDPSDPSLTLNSVNLMSAAEERGSEAMPDSSPSLPPLSEIKYRKSYKTHLGGISGNPSITPNNFDSGVKMAQNTTPASQKKIVILGGSNGGVSTAHYLLKHVVPTLPDKASYQVIIVSASSQAMCRPACPRAMISDDMFPQEKLFVNIPKAFEQYPQGSFRFIHGTATKLDHINQTVSISLAISNTKKIDFYALVIATGASTPSSLLALPTAKSIVIAGGGPAGIETAGELGEFLNGRAGWLSSKLANPKVRITVVSADSKILPALRPAIAKKAEKYLANVGVTVVKNARVTTVEPHGAGTDSATTKATLTLEDGKTLDADLYIPATGTRPNTGLRSRH